VTLATRRARFAGWSRKSARLPREAWVLIAANAVAALGYGVVSPVLPAFARTFGVSLGAVTFSITIFSVMRLFSAPPTGLLVQRLGERLVYVAGLAPAEGQTVADVFYLNAAHALAPKLAPDGHGLIWLPEEAFSTAFAPNASATEQALLSALQRPISAACITVPVSRPLWMDIPSWYLLAKDDRMIVAQTQRFMAERMQATVRAYPVDHTPSVTAPEVVTELLHDVLRQING